MVARLNRLPSSGALNKTSSGVMSSSPVIKVFMSELESEQPKHSSMGRQSMLMSARV